MVAYYTQVPPVRLFGARVWEDAWRASDGHFQDFWHPLGLLLQGVGWWADSGLLHSGAACETLRPRLLEDAWQATGGHLEDLWRPLGLLL